MKRGLIIFAAVISLWHPFSGNCENVTGNVDFAVGVLHTDHHFSKAFNLDKRIEFGACCDFKKASWPVSIAFDYLFSYADAKISNSPDMPAKKINASLICSETYLGIKKLFNFYPSVIPFAGAGAYIVNMFIDKSDDDYHIGIGPWVEFGTYFVMSKHLNVGLAWRWSKARLRISDRGYDAGGNHFDIMAGYHF